MWLGIHGYIVGSTLLDIYTLPYLGQITGVCVVLLSLLRCIAKVLTIWRMRMDSAPASL